MRRPLFSRMRAAAGCRLVPAEMRHSPVMCVQYLQEQNPYFFRMYLDTMNGRDIIDAISLRCLRSKMPVSGAELARVQKRIAPSIYDHGGQLSRFFQDTLALESMCRSRLDEVQNLYFNDGNKLRHAWGIQRDHRPIFLRVERGIECRWCGATIFPKASWEKHQWDHKTYNGYHCGSRDCRRMNYLQDVPQSRGGIDLTPSQKRALDYKAHDGQRALNYLQLVAKEIKRGSRANHVVR